MQVLPLLATDALDARIAYYGDAPVSAGQFVAHAQHLAQALPQATHAINLAENRYHFLLGCVAAWLRGQIILLPSSQATGVIAELQRDYPDHHVIDDASVARHLSSRESAAPTPDWQLPADRIVAIAFTSGTTGRPQAHPKTWGSLFHNSRLATEDVLGGPGSSVVATVPPQHMYGLEASLIGALSAGCCLCDRRPFFPADVRDALRRMPAPRTLVTTPAHLKVLAESSIELPPLHRVVSATAPLTVKLARRIEARWQTEVVEIYGCTEAGVMAHRRTTATERWRTLRDGTIVQVNGNAEYRAPQLPTATPLQDVIEPLGDSEFVLRGRAGDMIKVAGKRTSLQELTRQVLAVPGVVDAAVFVRESEERPVALVVAPGRQASDILDALRRQMEPVFVPRPLLIVERLPRNDVGKLPREALLQLLRQVRP
ncbi:MAG TPA: AMP-binding protein [Povalibacter sp.]|uniref:AMP-binding protein n=1 Tax=Povalibacter sp. TaxID=1962978 RepID=UPI002BAA439B|nr:AMP-binding protein [Povalibacter sp.]HMN44786.1 AMP-binding protein [Povalibacter sp.]